MAIMFVMDAGLHQIVSNFVTECLHRLANLLVMVKRKSSSSNLNAIGISCIVPNPHSNIFQLQVLLPAKGCFDYRTFYLALENYADTLHSFKKDRFQKQDCKNSICALSSLVDEKKENLAWSSCDLNKKIILLSSHFSFNAPSFKSTLHSFASLCISIDFYRLSVSSSFPSEFHSNSNSNLNVTSNVNSNFENWMDLSSLISDFENCTFQNVDCDPILLSRLSKVWLKEMMEDADECSMEIVIRFSPCIFENLNSIHCSLTPLLLPLHNSFRPCQTCKCHGIQIKTNSYSANDDNNHNPVSNCNGVSKENHNNNSSNNNNHNQTSKCAISLKELNDDEINSHALSIGNDTILYIPSFENISNQFKIKSMDKSFHHAIHLHVISKIDLLTLNESLFYGFPYAAAPSTVFDFDLLAQNDLSPIERNAQIFDSVFRTLDACNHCLLCSSTIDFDTREESTFLSYYVLIPGKGGTCLIRQIAASEDILLPPVQVHLPDVPQNVSDEVAYSLSKMKCEKYDPLNYEHGHHSKLHSLVKKSLHFETVPVPVKPREFRKLNALHKHYPHDYHNNNSSNNNNNNNNDNTITQNNGFAVNNMHITSFTHSNSDPYDFHDEAFECNDASITNEQHCVNNDIDGGVFGGDYGIHLYHPQVNWSTFNGQHSFPLTNQIQKEDKSQAKSRVKKSSAAINNAAATVRKNGSRFREELGTKPKRGSCRK